LQRGLRGFAKNINKPRCTGKLSKISHISHESSPFSNFLVLLILVECGQIANQEMGLEPKALEHVVHLNAVNRVSIPRNQATAKIPASPSLEIRSQLLIYARYCGGGHRLFGLHNHQASRAWAPGVIHVQAVSSSRLSINPFSLAAKNVSSRTVTVSSPCPASADSDCGTATKVRVFFAEA
jgi:hypothetical protein